jgi:hypothetical protein
VHGLVVHETVGQRDEYRLQNAVPSRRGFSGDAGLVVRQQGCATMDGRTGALAANARRLAELDRSKCGLRAARLYAAGLNATDGS